MAIKHWRCYFVVLLMLSTNSFSAQAVTPPGMAAPASTVVVAIPPQLRNAPEMARLLRDWDGGSVLAMEVGRQAPRQVLGRAAMQRTRIQTESGESMEVARLFDTTFAAQRSLDQQVNRIPAAALVGRPQVNEAVVEFPDRLLLLRQVRIVVRDPELAVAAAPELARFLSPVDMAEAVLARVDRLSPDEQRDFRRFIREELPLLEADDPLRQALTEGGEDAVLRAALRGVGEFEITDQVVLERRLFNDGGLRLHEYERFRPLVQQRNQMPALAPLRPQASLRKQQTPHSLLAGPAAKGRDYRYPAGEQREGRLEFSEPFLAGFTLGQELAWERKWRFGAGFLRINYGMGYGFGLRIPVALNGRLDPVRSIRSAIDDPGRELSLRVQAVTSDALEPYYERVGLAKAQHFGGDEFVFTAGSWFGFKLYALGRNWAQLAPVNSPWHKSHSFMPPLGGSQRPFLTFEVPPELTNTGIDLGPLRGYLQVGVGLNGAGSALVPYALLVDGQPVVEQQLVLASTNAHTETLRLPPLSGQPGTMVQQSYGLQLGAPAYLMDMSVAMRLRVAMEVRAGPLKRSINTDWLDVFTLPLGRIPLPPHAGTRGRYEWNDGVRIFEVRDPAGPATMQAPRNLPMLH